MHSKQMDNIWESTTVCGSINPKDFGEHLHSGFTNSNGYSYNNIVIKSLRPSVVPCSFTVMAYKWRNPQGKNLYNIGVRANIYNASHRMLIADNVKIFNWVVFDDAVYLINKLVELFITEIGLKDCGSAQI
jgi:hypothetical protein